MSATPARRNRAVQSGFTLVEMMVAVTILSLVMLATVTGFRTLAATQGSLASVTNRNDELRSVSSFLRDALESAVVGSDGGGLSLGGGGLDKAFFEMGPEQLLWNTGLVFGESEGGSFTVHVAREEGKLVLRWQQMNRKGQLAPWNNAAARTLVDNVQEFAVAYRRMPGEPWLSDWDGRGTPGWVRLRVRASERYWPDIVMEVAR